ncbi:hypothetical protein BZG02_20020 [Labilibaculum filiforme]|uniref:Uncharacterized protein n=1 Tax=Labilibaculum filiforme TaxID=1940526 RepID=A0A2N3HQG6_9BACT|nr:hypothetical protein [Labilibaculum filiforme]PKQ60288.1 hypothetical protein BZG02_20020 [Labilibaculum filiforme]
MSYLNISEAERIITGEEFKRLQPIVEKNQMAIRCNKGSEYKGGDGYNLEVNISDNDVKFATALYASICFSQDTIQSGIDSYKLLLLKKCALSSSETYKYTQGSDVYNTLFKCSGLGKDATVIFALNMNDSAITMARRVVEKILELK